MKLDQSQMLITIGVGHDKTITGDNSHFMFRFISFFLIFKLSKFHHGRQMTSLKVRSRRIYLLTLKFLIAYIKLHKSASILRIIISNSLPCMLTYRLCDNSYPPFHTLKFHTWFFTPRFSITYSCLIKSLSLLQYIYIYIYC